MFGLYMVIIFIGARIVSSIIERKSELDWRNKARKNGDPIWVDRYGTTHHTENDKPFMYTTDYKTGDVVERNPYNGKIYRNVSRENRKKLEEERKNEAIKNGCRLYAYEPLGLNFNHTGEKIEGSRWKDIYTGEIYVPRQINHSNSFFYNIEKCTFDFYDDDHLTEEEIEEKLQWANKENERYINMANKDGCDWHKYSYGIVPRMSTEPRIKI